MEEPWECLQRREELRRWIRLLKEEVERLANMGADYVEAADLWVVRDLVRAAEATVRRLRSVCPQA